MKQEVIALAAAGMLGSGFSDETFRQALALNPDFIGCDCGSMDSGPYCLGKGVSNRSRTAVKRDLSRIIPAALEKKIPALFGSAGTAGGDLNVDWMVSILKEIALEQNLHFKLAVIKSELSKEQLRAYMAAGKIKPLHPAPALTGELIDSTAHAVAMLGAEPYIEALNNGADVVIAGRSSDVSIYAAVPKMLGLGYGPAYHAGKLLECGVGCTERKTRSDCMLAWIHKDDFIIEPPNPDMRCTPVSCAAHALYESSDPYDLVEPGEVVHIRDCKYEAISDRAVKVSGSTVEKTPYTVRLEGSRFLGYRQYVFGSIRDPLIIRQLDSFLDRAAEAVFKKTLSSLGLEHSRNYQYCAKVYGQSKKYQAEEVCVLVQIVADTQEKAAAIGDLVWHELLHHDIPEWVGLQSNMAFPFSLPSVAGGEGYEFCLNHVIELDNPLEVARFEYVKL